MLGRYLSYGEALGSYKDASGSALLKGYALELTPWQNQTDLLVNDITIGQYRLNELSDIKDDIKNVDYERLMYFSGSLGLKIDLWLLELLPQIRVGLGEEKFSKATLCDDGSELEFEEIKRNYISYSTEFIVQFTKFENFAIGAKWSQYYEDTKIKYLDDVGKLKMNETVMIMIGWTDKRKYSPTAGMIEPFSFDRR